MSDRYCLVGEDVSRSLSPSMMSSAFRTSGIDATYEAISVEREGFRERFLSLREVMKGLNVTIPYKSEVIPLLDELDPISSRIGAVNVVKRSGSRYLGFNTDAHGISASLKDHGKGSPESALLVGAGGAARAFCEAMSELRCRRVTVAVRDTARGEAFAREMSGVFPQLEFRFKNISALKEATVDLVFNATPIGTSGVELPLPDGLDRVIYGRATVFDAVYRPMKTDLLTRAERRGCSVIYGYEMLLNQGALAFELWTGRPAPKEAMREALLRSLGDAA